MVWLDDWEKRIPIEIDSTKIDEDLTDFPVLITLSGSEVFESLTVSGGVDTYDAFFLETSGEESFLGNDIKIGRSGSTFEGPVFSVSSGIYCVYFDGSNDAIYASSITAYDLEVEDFTIEAWVNATLLSSGYRVLSNGVLDGSGALNGSWAFGIGDWGSGVKMNFTIRVQDTVYSFDSDVLSSYISVNTWNHIALVRNSGTLFFYLNGVQRGSVVCNYNIVLAGASNLTIGYRVSGSSQTEIFFGYLARLRISKGIPRYTSSFIPPTSYVNDSYTKFLFLNKTNHNIALSDLVIKTRGETILTKTTVPFNKSAAWELGSTDDVLIIDDSPVLDFGSNNFTIESWIYLKQHDTNFKAIFGKRLTTSSHYAWVSVYVDNNGYLKALVSNNGSSWGINFTSGYVPAGKWVHFALVRSGDTFDFYFDGIKTNTGVMSGSVYKETTSLYLGAGSAALDWDWRGYIYGFRISKGIARYSDNFTPSDPLEFNSSFGNRKKIAITDSTNNQLYTEIERWSHSERKAWLWTKVPTVSSGTNTKLYLYYDKSKSDNTSYVGDISSLPARNVWDSGYKAVYHLCTNPAGGGNVKDSTSNAFHGTGVNMSTGSLFAGRIGISSSFNGTNSYIDLPNLGFSGDVDVTLESLFRVTGTAIAYTLVGFGLNQTSRACTIRTGNRLATVGDTAGDFYFWNNDLEMTNLGTYYGNWTYFAGAYNAAASIRRVYYNGTLKAQDSPSDPNFYDGTYRIARNVAGGEYFKGEIDEVRISSVPRSSAWIKATYYSFFNDLLLFGSVEERPYFFYEGYVKVQGVPAARRVHLYRRSTGQLVDTTISDASTGYFKLQSRFPDYHFVVALANLEESFPPLFDDRIHPEL